MTRRRSMLAAALGAGVSVVAGCGRGNTQASGSGGFAAGVAIEETIPADKRGEPVPVTGELLDGTPFDLSAWAGHVVVVNFWGSWCAPCRLEAKDLQAAYTATKDLGVRFLGVDVRDDRDRAEAFAGAFGITYPSVFDPAGRTGLAFTDLPPNVVPTTAILDRQHRPATIFRRVVLQDELESAIKALTAEPD